MFRKKPQAQSDLPMISDKMLATVGGWFDHFGSVPDGFDAATYHAVKDSVMDAVVGHGGAVQRPEGRAALVKVLAASLCMAAYHDTDEDVFALTQRVRGELYAEVMKFRRAVECDVRGEARADVG